jgi:hypothetical protein
MADCSFDKFLLTFAKIIEELKAYCKTLGSIPSRCEKRFRVSFYGEERKSYRCVLIRILVPAGIELGPFANATRYEYSPNMSVSDIGYAALPGVAYVLIELPNLIRLLSRVGALMRTSYMASEQV